ncbi:MAG: DEAD/DEAH box helicase [Candidatus Thermoplasmatota archaeon]|jgi:helicase|nr:DEAD/DEAH box helicase [Candidatus Thermoplasmatota archaeon]
MGPKFPDEFLQYLKEEGIGELYPHQKESVEIIDAGKSLLLATPTSSGKSLVAYFGMIRAWKRGLKSLYTVPLRALAEEKWNEIQFFKKFGMKIMISTGDYDRGSEYLRDYDVIISTSEKVDSLLRNNPNVFENLGFVVFDEIHNIMDESRGHTLEIVINKIRYAFEGIQFLAMSATVNNVTSVADWLESASVSSDFRPVPLHRFVIAGDTIYDEYGESAGEAGTLEEMVVGTLRNGGQTLVFVNSRKATEKFAERISSLVDQSLTQRERENLSDIPLSNESTGYDKIVPILKKGVGFHHAGMLSEQRRLVERLFKQGKLKLIVATTTLAAGMNLPARSVIVKDIHRYDGSYSVMIPNLEVQQMLGRAGRVKYDSFGNGYIYTTRTRLKDVFNEYLHGPLEDIVSKIDERKVRMHVLGLISSGICKNEDSLNKFFALTFASKQGIDLEPWVARSIEFLKENDMIRGVDVMKPTPFGRRVSELYIDPMTGVKLRDLVNIVDLDELLIGISATPDMPKLYVGEREESVFYQTGKSNIDAEEGQVKVAMILRDWIEELSEDSIVEKYNVWPADIRNRVEIGDWLSHSLYEIARVLGKGRTDLRILNYRIANGVMEDLVKLTFLPNIGRVRARRLRMNGYDLERIAQADPADIQRIAGFGEKISENVIKEAKKITERGITFGL